MNNGPRIAREKVTRLLLARNLVKSPLWRFTVFAKHLALPRVEKGESAKQEEEEEKHQNDENDALEAVIDTAGNYSVDATSSVLSPFLLVIFFVFDNEFKFQDVYNFSKLAPLYYLVFVLVVMGMQPLVDAILLQVVELHLKVKIYEYFVLQEREYRRRRHWWKAHDREQEDTTVTMTYRSMHHWAFSSQYYAIVALAASALIGLVFSVECWLRQSFDPLEDPMLALIVGGSLLGCKAIKIVCEGAAFAVNLWNCRKRFTLSRTQLERHRARGKLGGQGGIRRGDSVSTNTGITGRSRGSSSSLRTSGRAGSVVTGTRANSVVLASGHSLMSSGSGVIRGNARFEQRKGANVAAVRAAPNVLGSASSKGAHWAVMLRNRMVAPNAYPYPSAANPDRDHEQRDREAVSEDEMEAFRRWREQRHAQQTREGARRRLREHERLFAAPPVPPRRSRSAPQRSRSRQPPRLRAGYDETNLYDVNGVRRRRRRARSASDSESASVSASPPPSTPTPTSTLSESEVSRGRRHRRRRRSSSASRSPSNATSTADSDSSRGAPSRGRRRRSWSGTRSASDREPATLESSDSRSRRRGSESTRSASDSRSEDDTTATATATLTSDTPTGSTLTGSSSSTVVARRYTLAAPAPDWRAPVTHHRPILDDGRGRARWKRTTSASHDQQTSTETRTSTSASQTPTSASATADRDDETSSGGEGGRRTPSPGVSTASYEALPRLVDISQPLQGRTGPAGGAQGGTRRASMSHNIVIM
eukprot:tig00020816_g14184.t1